MRVVVTQHALDRYIERIEPVGRDRAHAIIAGAERGIEAAARFGATTVRAGKAKLILQVHHVPAPGGGQLVEARVVTVIPRNWIEHRELNMAEHLARHAAHHLGRAAA